MRALILLPLLLLPVSQSTQTLTVKGEPTRIVLQGKGNPPVIFESGLGEDATTWAAVQPAVSQFATTLSFDRPGLGASPPTSAARDGVTLAQELHDLIHEAGLVPPYVLVGHSLGGAVVQLFADRYPTDVAGLVLVDPEDGRIVQRLKARLTASQWNEREKALARHGPMPPAVQREFDAMVAEGGAQVAQISSLPAVPSILLTGTAVDSSFPGNPEEQRLKWELHHELLLRNPGMKQVQVPESRHYIQNDAPETVIVSIRSIWANSQRASEPVHNR